MGQANSHGLVAYADYQPPLTAGVSTLGAEIGESLQYDKTLRSTRFMKTIRCFHPREGLLVVRIFTKPTYMKLRLHLDPYIRRIKEQHSLVHDLENILSYPSVIETDRAVFLVRQYAQHNLYDRISTRPFLSDIEKKWIAFQILVGLRESHAVGACHGSIRTENVLLTSWNWVYLTDYAPYKPTYLPADDPAIFSYYFDTSMRRVCYVAPERFYDPDSPTARMLANKDDSVRKNLALLPSMDVFSVGCVVAELMLDGKPLFSLSSLLQYRKNSLDVESALLSKVEDRSVREMILEMVALDPSRRPSIDECLGRWRSSVFPEWFYSPLYPELLDVGSALPQGPSGAGGPDKNALLATHGSPATVISVSELDGLGSDEAPGILLHTSDGRIAKLYNRWPVLAPLLSLYPGLHIDESVAIHDLAGPHDAAVILLSFVLSYVRNCAYPSSRRHGLEIILSLSHSLDDSVIMDRVVPLVTSMATRDEAAFVRASAIFALRVLLLNVDEIRPVDAKVFDDYLIPQLNHMATDPEPMVRIALSRTIADFLETAYRIAGMTDDTGAGSLQSSPLADNHDLLGPSIYSPEAVQMGHTSEGGGQEERIIALQLQFRNTIGHLLADSSAEVKRALLASLPRLCFFFHRSSIAVDSASAKHGPAVPWDAAENDTRDFLLSHIITYLNDRDSWLLRSHFFEAIVGIALLVGRHALEEYILPLMNQAMADSEEYVIGSVLRAFTRLAEGGLLGKHSVREKVREVAPLLVHPNPWLRECALRFIEAGGNVLPEIDHLVVISPAIRQCLRYEALELTYEALSEALDTPVPVKAYQEAVQLTMTLDRPLPEETFGQELRHLAASVPNADRFPIVKSLPLCECRKLTTLRRYIEDAARNIQRQTLQLINRNDGMTESDGPVTDGIQLKNVGVTLHTVFLSPNDAQKTEPVLAAARHQQMSSGDPLRPTSSRIGEFAGESSRPSFSSDVPSVMSERQRQQQQQYMSQPYVVSRDRTPSVLSVNTTDTATEATVAATVGVASRQRGTAGSRRESSYASISNVVATAVPPTSSNVCSGTHEGKNHSHTCSPGNGDACHQAEVLFQLQQLNIDYASSGRASVKSDHDSGALSAEPGDAYRRRGAEKHAPASPSSGLQGSAGSAGGSNRQEMTRSTGGSYATTRGESYVTGDYGRRRSVARLLHKKANQAFPLACSDLGPSYYPAPSKLPVHQRAVGSGGSNSSRGGSGGGVLRGFGVASMAGGKGWGPEGILVANLCEHQDSVRTMAISADNVLLATGGDDGVVRVWDCQAFVKNSVHRSSAIHHQGGRIQSLAFVAQTHSLVACSDNGRIDLIAVEIEEASEMVNAPIRRGQCCLVRKYMLRQREYGVQCQYLKSDEASYLVVATNQSRVIALDMRTFEKQWEASMKFSYGRITCFVCDQHQRSWMLLGTAMGRLLLLDLRFRMVVQVYTHPLSAVINQMCLYAESRASEASVLVATSNGEVGVFGVESGEWKLVLSTRGWEEIQQDLQQSHILAQTSPETSGLPPALIELVHHRTAAESGDSDAEDDQSPDPSSPQSIVDRHTVSTPSSVRAICHLPGSAYVIAGGNDTKIRSWNIQRLDKSYVISSNGYADRFSYNSYRIGNTLYHCESVPQNSTTAAATRLRGQSIGSGRNRPLSQQSVLSAATVAASYHRREGSTASAQGSEAHSLVTGPSSGSNARGRLSVNQLGDNDTEVTSMHSNDGGDQYRMASTASTPQIPMSPVKRRLVPPELDQQVGRHTDAITCMQITQYPHLMLIVGARDGVIKVYI